MDLNEFFEKVYNGELTDLEIYNYLEKITEHFNHDKTKLALNDLGFFMFLLREELESNCNFNEIIGDNKKYKSMDDVPYKLVKNLFNGSTRKSYDYEALFFPYQLFTLQKVKNLLNQKLGVIKKRKNFLQSIDKNLDLLSKSQKKVLHAFIEKGFNDSHIYRFLKNEKNFINITELEYIRYMNKVYSKGWKENKRITSFKDLTFKKEMYDFYNEIVLKTT
jgi:hypothetical protein